MTARRRLVRWLMFALACLALGASAVPARAEAQVDLAAQVSRLKRESARARPSRSRREGFVVRSADRQGRRLASRLAPRPESIHLPGPPVGLFLRHQALLR